MKVTRTINAVLWGLLAICLAGFLANNTTVLSTAASAMALVINGAR